MRRHHVRTTAGLLLGALLALAVALSLPLDASGQETPTAEEGAPPAGQAALVLRPPEEMPIDVDEELDVLLDVENVEGLAAFDAAIFYDWERLEWLGGGIGAFFTEQERDDFCLPEDGPRGEIEFRGAEGDMQTIADALVAQGLAEQDVVVTTAPDAEAAVVARVTVEQMGPAIETGTPHQTRVVFSCLTLNPTVSEGGPPGVSGSGTLGSIHFRAVESGDAEVEFEELHNLVLDESDEAGNVQPIEHTVEGAVVEISGDSFPWLIVIIVAVVVVVIIGGAAGFWFARRRSSSAPAPPPSPSV
jgi:hypothetical protein